MVIIASVDGNILEQNEHNIICQQCNCVTLTSKGLAEQIAKKYPWADIYARRKYNGKNKHSFPGTIELNNDSGTVIVHMFGQVFPGRYGSNRFYEHITLKDGPQERINYFKQCLQHLDNLNLSVPVAMPYKIGCGLAGGNWEIYEKLLQECKTRIVLYKIV